jgi:hypothetical protein
MKTLATFILVGTIDSHDGQFATVELNTNPASNGGPSIAIMPVNAFPCEIYEGKVFYVVKLSELMDAVVICQEDAKDEPIRKRTD